MTAYAPHTPPHETRRAAGRPARNKTNWRDWRACAGSDPDEFASDDPRVQENAKKICAVCPVRKFCLEFALENGIDFGVYGGTDGRERRTVSRRRPARERVSDLIDDVVKYRRAGMSWNRIEYRMDLPAGTLRRSVARWAAREQQAGRSVPLGLLEERRWNVTQGLVVEIRQRAAEGESDAEQALRTGLSQSFVRRIATGDRYPEIGGPLRAKRPGHASRPKPSSFTQFNKGRASYYPKELAS